MKFLRLPCAAALLALAAGCAVGPDYRTPDTPLPVSWKLEEPWRLSTPSDGADKGSWWKRFDDATLDTLQAQALAGSPTLAIANARLAQARATLAATSASRYPQLGLGARASRLKIWPTGRSPTTPPPIRRRCRTTSPSR